MALRHPIPAGLLKSDFGGDEQRVAPKFVEPKCVEFASGKNLEEFAALIMSNSQVRVVAAAGAGKSVRMPQELVKISGKVVVHCVPSILLAASLHDYVSTVVEKGIPVHFLDDIVDDYPASGLVYTSSSVFVWQCARWRARGFDPGVVLYVDEAHESDGATMNLRDLRTGVHGVDKYIEASATFGSGDPSRPFVAARLPSTVCDKNFAFPHAVDWDVDASSVPWATSKLQGDMLCIVDDPEQASILVDKFAAAGMLSYRFHSKMSVEFFRQCKKSLDDVKRTIPAFVAMDYSFRSGHTFMRPARILDLCKVRYFIEERGVTRAKYRDAYSSEVYQARNRGGRIAGRDCDYIRPKYTVSNTTVLAEGAEADYACVVRRALGYSIPGYMATRKFSKGDVPAAIVQVMQGDDMLACYLCDKPWPGKPVEVVEEVDAKPLVMSSPVEVDAASMFSLDDDVSFADGDAITREQYEELRRASYVKTTLVEPGESHHRERVTTNLHTLREIGDMSSDRCNMVIGKFYKFRDKRLQDIDRGNFPDGVCGIAAAAGDQSVSMHVRYMTIPLREEAISIAMKTYNQHAAKAKACTDVVAGIRNRSSGDLENIDVSAFKDWLKLMRDFILAAESGMALALEILHPASNIVVESAPLEYQDDIVAHVRLCMNFLRLCTVKRNDMSTVDFDVGADVVHNYSALGGRYRAQIVGGSLRERVAKKVLGKDNVNVELV